MTKWERYAQKAQSGIFTSTLIEGTASIIAAMDEQAGDYTCDFPLAVWYLQANPASRIYEVDGPQAWHNLCSRYPAKAVDDDRLVPDWPSVAADWDGVHLTFGGLLTSEQVRVESAAGWSEHWAWHVEQTLWLRWMFDTYQRLPDHDETEIPGLDHPWIQASFAGATPLTKWEPS